LDSSLVSEASKFHFISNYRADSIQALLRMIFIFIIITNIIYDLGEAKLYHFDSDSGNLDSNWKSNALSKWNPVLDEYHPHNHFLTTELSEGERYLSTEVDGDGLSTLTFDWEKIGEYAELIFYFDDKTDKNNITACNYHNGLGPVRPITIPPGHHIATWDFKVSRPSSGNGIACSQAWLDNINIPEYIIKSDCTISAPSEVCANSTYESSVPTQDGVAYAWEVIGCTPKSPLNAPRITWISGTSGTIDLKATVTKNGVTNHSIRKVNINQACRLLIPPCKDLQSIINNSSNKILYLQSGLYGGPEGPNYPIEINSNVSNVTIMPEDANKGGVELDCGSSHYGFGINDTSKITIKNLNISMCSLGIIIKLSENCKISNNNISFSSTFSNGSGIYLDNSSDNIIRNNHIDYAGPGDQNISGFALYYSNKNKILNNHVLLPREKFVFFIEGSCSNSLSYYKNEGHIHENGVDCNETWNKCSAKPCRCCTDPMFASCNTWWFL